MGRDELQDFTKYIDGFAERQEYSARENAKTPVESMKLSLSQLRPVSTDGKYIADLDSLFDKLSDQSANFTDWYRTVGFGGVEFILEHYQELFPAEECSKSLDNFFRTYLGIAMEDKADPLISIAHSVGKDYLFVKKQLGN